MTLKEILSLKSRELAARHMPDHFSFGGEYLDDAAMAAQLGHEYVVASDFLIGQIRGDFITAMSDAVVHTIDWLCDLALNYDSFSQSALRAGATSGTVILFGGRQLRLPRSLVITVSHDGERGVVVPKWSIAPVDYRHVDDRSAGARWVCKVHTFRVGYGHVSRRHFRENGGFNCESCGNAFLGDSRANVPGRVLCRSCHRIMTPNRALAVGTSELLDYSFNAVRLGFLRCEGESAKRALYFGVELEVYAAGVEDGAIEMYELIAQIHGAGGGGLVCKRDGSLASDYGFEINSAPATLAYHRQFLWREFYEKSAKHLRGWNRKECGLHVHLSRDAFVDAWHIARFARFIERAENAVLVDAISGRRWRFNSYCGGVRRSVKDGIKGDHTNAGRYAAVNFVTGSKPTVEVRIFRSNTSPLGVFRVLEFLAAVFEFTRGRGIADSDLGWADLIAWCAARSNAYRVFLHWAAGEGLASSRFRLRASDGRLWSHVYAASGGQRSQVS